MAPQKPLPYSAEFASTDEYVDSLLKFCAASTVFQTLCGGVHILDFFTQEVSLYHTVIPEEWRTWLLERDSIDLLDFLMRDDLSKELDERPPESLLQYVRTIRTHSLQRNVTGKQSTTKLPRHVAVGMIPKKVHEVTNFADYVAKVADDQITISGKEITHFVDFGSGQNYLGRTLACPPYNKHIVAVESKEINISGAKYMDVLAGVAEREVVMRNKKLYRQQVYSKTPVEQLKGKEIRRVAKPPKINPSIMVDLRPIKDLNTIYTPMDGKGYVQYVEHRVKDGDLSDVVQQIEEMKRKAPSGNVKILSDNTNTSDECQVSKVLSEVSKPQETRLMAISIHSCGNLSHHGIRSLVLNPTVHAIAIVGCCYNLLTERLGPSYKHPELRPTLRPINALSSHTAGDYDEHGFPMSTRLATHDGEGLRLNITARMMAVQAPQNWTAQESDAFFTRHFFRALLQKVFLDRGVVSLLPAVRGTDPVIIGSLRKRYYDSFLTYVRGALEKMAKDEERGPLITQKMGDITDEEIMDYARKYEKLKKELSVTWSLMAFSAAVVESLIVVDRWLFLGEQDEVGDAWVEAVFDYKLSPRNLVVVGIKK